MSVEIFVNGEPQRILVTSSIADLLGQLGYTNKRIAVEINRDIVPRSSYAKRTVQAGDRIEIVHAIGGG